MPDLHLDGLERGVPEVAFGGVSALVAWPVAEARGSLDDGVDAAEVLGGHG